MFAPAAHNRAGMGALIREWPIPHTPLCFSVFKGLESWYIDGQAIKRGNRSSPPATPTTQTTDP